MKTIEIIGAITLSLIITYLSFEAFMTVELTETQTFVISNESL